MIRIWRFLRYVLADELRLLANRVDPDMIVRREYGGITIERRR